jgi:WD40 repeat protein
VADILRDKGGSIDQSLTLAAPLYEQPVLVIDPGKHTAPIMDVGVDAAGRIAVTGSLDKTLRVWSLTDGELLRTIRMPAGPANIGQMYAVAVQPDGALVAAGGWTNGPPEDSIYVFETQTGKMAARIAGLPSTTHSLAFSPDGHYLAAGLYGTGGLRVYDRQEQWREVVRDTDYGDDIRGITFSADGQLATTSYDGKVRLYDRAFRLVVPPKKVTGGSRHGSVLPLPTPPPFRIAFSPDGALLAIGYEDAPIVDLLDGQSLAALPRPDLDGLSNGSLRHVTWSKDGGTLYAGGQYQTGGTDIPVLAWANAGRGARRALPAARNSISGLAALPDGRLLVATQDPFLELLEPDGRPRWAPHTSPKADFRNQEDRLAVSADGTVVDFGFEPWGKSPLRFDLRARKLVGDPPVDRQTIPPKQAGLAVEGWRNDYSPTLDGKPIALSPYEMSRSLAIHPDSSRFVLGAEYLRAFDAKGNGELRRGGMGLLTLGVRILTVTDEIADSLNVHPARGALITGVDDRGPAKPAGIEPGDVVVKFDGKDIKERKDLSHIVADTTIGKEVEVVVIRKGREEAHKVTLGKLENTDEVVQPIWQRAAPSAVWAVNISGDGRLAVAAYGDGTISWHRMDDGRELLALYVLADKQNWVAWTPEGFYAATAGAFGVLQWQVNRGLDAAADTVPVNTIPRLRRPDALALVLQELETPRALGLADLKAARRDVQFATRSAKAPGARLHVLTIGISDYGEKARNLKLNFAARDAQDVANALLNTQEGGLYAEVKPMFLHDVEADKSGIFEALAAIDRNMTSGAGQDLAVVMFSGHGTMIDNQFYLVPYGADESTMARLKASAIPATEFKSEIEKLARHGRVLVLLDACRSAGLIGSPANALPAAETLRAIMNAGNVTVLTSSTADKVSREDEKWGHGAFTKALLDALSDSDVDTNHDGVISMSDLTAYIEKRLTELTHGDQQLGLDQRFQGDIFVAGL